MLRANDSKSDQSIAAFNCMFISTRRNSLIKNYIPEIFPIVDIFGFFFNFPILWPL